MKASIVSGTGMLLRGVVALALVMLVLPALATQIPQSASAVDGNTTVPRVPASEVVPDRTAGHDPVALLHAGVSPLYANPPVWLQQGAIAPDGKANDNFGMHQVLDGNTALISNIVGSVYVYTQANDGSWSYTQTLHNDPNLASGGRKSMAIQGDTAIIGAPGTLVSAAGGVILQGVVYVFSKSADGTWTQTQKIVTHDNNVVSVAAFGQAVALDGDTLFVGSRPISNANFSIQASVRIFKNVDGQWEQIQKIDPPVDQDPYTLFGNAFAISGDNALIADYVASNGTTLTGLVYAYHRGADGTWTKETTFVPPDPEGYAHFGLRVALQGNTAFVGSPHYHYSSFAGRVFVYTKSGGAWSLSQQLTPPDSTSNNDFGTAIALHGDTALITAMRTKNAYLYVNTGGQWVPTREFFSVSAQSVRYPCFGFGSVGLSDSTALIGAHCMAPRGNRHQGVAYFYNKTDLALSINAPDVAGPGDTYVAHTIVTNVASAASPAVAATITVPAAASFVSASASQGGCSALSGVVSCRFGSVAGNGGTARASVTYKVTGNLGGILVNTVSIEKSFPKLTTGAVTQIRNNTAPVASDGSLTTDKNTSVTGTLEARDADGDSLIFNIVTQPEHGMVSLSNSATGGFIYRPDEGYSGSDLFTFNASDGAMDSNTATVTITVVNHPPVASDGTLSTDKNTAASGTLKASDDDGDTLTFSIVSQPQNGTLTLNDPATGTYTYTPDKKFTGSDSFTFKASDGEVDSNVATVSITVNKPKTNGDGGGGAFGWFVLAALLALGLSTAVFRRR